MYENIGKKIKSLAQGMFIVEAILSIIAGLVIIATDDDVIVVGIIMLILGPVLAWISSWLLYGFGELIDKVCDIEKKIKDKE